MLISSTVYIPYALHPFNICITYPNFWNILKFLYPFISIISFCILYSAFFLRIPSKNISSYSPLINNLNSLHLFIGYTEQKQPCIISEKSMFQNILITGTIGTGKTSSAMYPFTKQIISYQSYNANQKIAMLILDVKGNYYKKVEEYSNEFGRKEDLIIIELNGKFNYNPLDKPNLKANILANRLKTILTIFSPNQSDSYWLDKVEQVLTECIKLCRLYNNGYVTFLEIHKLINFPHYYNLKMEELRSVFQSKKLSSEDIYNLSSSLDFFETEWNQLDPRVLSIVKSEITRITSVFTSDYSVLNTFCPSKENLSFQGFKEVLSKGKIVVFNMNIAEYKLLSKILAAYLKLDFQTEVMSQLNSNLQRITAFISDEFHEYVTSTDADFFSQSREAKCINIVSTQSYTSLLNTLKDESTVKVITQNLINKIWLRNDDLFTIEEAQKQIGREEKIQLSKTISENAKETNYNYFTHCFISHGSSLNESINSYSHIDFIYETNFFTQKLESFQALVFLSDGTKIISPQKINLIPYFSNNKSNFYERS